MVRTCFKITCCGNCVTYELDDFITERMSSCLDGRGLFKKKFNDVADEDLFT